MDALQKTSSGQAELIGDVGVELETRGTPAFCVFVCGGFTAATGTEELSI